jgi:hypothetical protein
MEGDYYVFDLLDDDIFLRVRTLLKERALTAEGIDRINNDEVSKS